MIAAQTVERQQPTYHDDRRPTAITFIVDSTAADLALRRLLTTPTARLVSVEPQERPHMK